MKASFTRADTVARDEIARLGELLYLRQLAHGSAGNLSARLEDGSILVSPKHHLAAWPCATRRAQRDLPQLKQIRHI